MIPAAIMGLGPVGRSIARAALQHGALELVAAIDRDPKLAGRRLDELVEGVTSNLTVTSDAAAALAAVRGGVLLHATGSRLADVTPQLLAAVEARSSVVSACPELAYPWIDHAETARELDRAARAAGVSLLGTGVNPGFACDRLVVAAAAASGNIRRVHVRRSVDISKRRAPLLRKAGAGASVGAFEARAGAGEVGHVGLVHSAALVAAGLGLDCDAFEQAIEPVVAERPLEGPLAIRRGEVAGYRQRADALAAGALRVRLELTYAVGVPDHDSIAIDADPPIELALASGVSGDLATAWSVVNAAPLLIDARPGLLCVLDLPAGRSTASLR